MKVTIDDPVKLIQFTTIFQYLKLITDDVNLDFTENGLYAQALGSNHVCLVEIKIDKKWFSNYDINKACCLGINCETFHTILSCLEKNNKFDMQYDYGDTLNISIKCEKIEKQFEMRLLMIDVQSFDIPNVEYSADIIIISKSFTDYINELDLFGDNLLIKCDGKDSNNVTLESSGDNGKMNLIIDEDYMEEYSVEENIELIVNYSMIYIKKMTNFVKLSKTVELHLSNEVPLKMKYNLSDDETEDNYLNIYLAPKVEDD